MNTLKNNSWSFGIITNNLIIKNKAIAFENEQVISILNSISSLNIPKEKFEIIIVGGNNVGNLVLDNIKIIDFDESIKKAWITKKKNIIIDESKFENIAIVHDYVFFDKNWYEGYLKFETDMTSSEAGIGNFYGHAGRVGGNKCEQH